MSEKRSLEYALVRVTQFLQICEREIMNLNLKSEFYIFKTLCLKNYKMDGKKNSLKSRKHLS